MQRRIKETENIYNALPVMPTVGGGGAWAFVICAQLIRMAQALMAAHSKSAKQHVHGKFIKTGFRRIFQFVSSDRTRKKDGLGCDAKVHFTRKFSSGSRNRRRENGKEPAWFLNSSVNAMASGAW